jgi:hypothetical protein
MFEPCDICFSDRSALKLDPGDELVEDHCVSI